MHFRPPLHPGPAWAPQEVEAFKMPPKSNTFIHFSFAWDAYSYPVPYAQSHRSDVEIAPWTTKLIGRYFFYLISLLGLLFGVFFHFRRQRGRRAWYGPAAAVYQLQRAGYAMVSGALCAYIYLRNITIVWIGH